MEDQVNKCYLFQAFQFSAVSEDRLSQAVQLVKRDIRIQKEQDAIVHAQEASAKKKPSTSKRGNVKAVAPSRGKPLVSKIQTRSTKATGTQVR